MEVEKQTRQQAVLFVEGLPSTPFSTTLVIIPLHQQDDRPALRLLSVCLRFTMSEKITF